MGIIYIFYSPNKIIFTFVFPLEQVYLLLTMQTLSEMYFVSYIYIYNNDFICYKKDIRIYLWLHSIDKILCNNNPFRRLRVKEYAYIWKYFIIEKLFLRKKFANYVI